jgi:hypothetical protein
LVRGNMRWQEPGVWVAVDCRMVRQELVEWVAVECRMGRQELRPQEPRMVLEELNRMMLQLAVRSRMKGHRVSQELEVPQEHRTA